MERKKVTAVVNVSHHWSWKYLDKPKLLHRDLLNTKKKFICDTNQDLSKDLGKKSFRVIYLNNYINYRFRKTLLALAKRQPHEFPFIYTHLE